MLTSLRECGKQWVKTCGEGACVSREESVCTGFDSTVSIKGDWKTGLGVRSTNSSKEWYFVCGVFWVDVRSNKDGM